MEKEKKIEFKDIYKELSKIDVSGSGMVDQDYNGFNYLKWSYAFDQLSKRYNWEHDFTKEIDAQGVIIHTTVTIEGISRKMHLAVLDNANQAMKIEAYKYKTKRGTKDCEAVNSADISNAIMRCLVKNIAIFGLGINLYSGDSVPLGAIHLSDEEIKQELFAKFKPKEIEINAFLQSINWINLDQTYLDLNAEQIAIISNGLDKFMSKALLMPNQKGVENEK